jgi:predicted TIM-barrel fold metal-dependent hydrolase
MHDVLTRINDADGHEMIPSNLWGQCFGDYAGMLVPFIEKFLGPEVIGENALAVPDVTADDCEITDETVWTVRGPRAPGAIDMSRRLRVLDQMGVQRQFVFPTFGLVGLLLGCGEDYVRRVMQMDPGGFDVKAISRALMTGANDWAIRSLAVDPDRIRAVAVLPVDTVEEMMAEARRVVEGGARAIWIPSAVPPAGMSPADERLDEFWSFLVETNTAGILHLGTEFDFVKHPVWGDIPSFSPMFAPSVEIPGADIYNFATMHAAVSNYLTVMALGGVFERHPGLRFGAIECGANWVGPLLESLDMWLDIFPRAGTSLTLRPSEYLRRNVRVTPYHFEPIDRWLERYPAMVDMLAYGSDYPHVEGGKRSHLVMFDKVAPFGDEVLEKFFVRNAEWLMPA